MTNEPTDRDAPDEEAGTPWMPLRRLGLAANWVPIRRLTRRHRHRVARHLVQLEGRDRYLRFGYAASDAQVERYALALDFERDQVFGVFSRRLQLVALAHLAYPAPEAAWPDTAEFGVSVLPRYRGCGLGSRLFQVCCLHARNRQMQFLLIQALSENGAMLRIAERAGAWVESADAGTITQRLHLPDDNLLSHVEEAVETGLGELDFRLKRGARQVQDLVDSVQAEVKELLGDDAPRDEP